MRAPVVISIASLSLLLGTVAASPAARPIADRDAARVAEVRRIGAHFDSVLAELPARDVSGLTAAQRARRSALLATLGAYRDRREFPHNYDFPGQAVPYFVDRETGTLCAVAHLLAASGRRDIVDRVARANNNVWVRELAGDSAFTNWLDASGLTLDEAARIQVPYMQEPPPAASVSDDRAYVAGSALTAAGAVTASIWNARANTRGGSRVGNVLGVTAGVAALGLGATGMGRESVPPALGIANVAAGATSLWLSTRGIVRHRHDVAARSREGSASPERRATITPLLPVGRDSGPGVAVALTF